MAETFHFNISMISRGKSKSAVASAAYISCEKIKNEWDGEVHDYHNKKGLLHSEILLPNHVPKEFQDRSFLWNSVELNEKERKRRNHRLIQRGLIVERVIENPLIFTNEEIENLLNISTHTEEYRQAYEEMINWKDMEDETDIE